MVPGLIAIGVLVALACVPTLWPKYEWFRWLVLLVSIAITVYGGYIASAAQGSISGHEAIDGLGNGFARIEAFVGIVFFCVGATLTFFVGRGIARMRRKRA